jgi:hypothetical protein
VYQPQGNVVVVGDVLKEIIRRVLSEKTPSIGAERKS